MKQHLCAEEGVSKNGVGAAVAERDEGEAVDAHDVTRRKDNVVNAAHVEGRGCSDSAREGPSAVYTYRMPRGNKHRRSFCRIAHTIICNIEMTEASAQDAFTCVALHCNHRHHGIIVDAHNVNNARPSPHARARPQELDFRVCSICEFDERVRGETASVPVHEPDHA